MENIQKSDLFQVVEKLWLSQFLNHFSYEVGLSGGVDSIVLLDLMVRLQAKYQFELSAVHINHGLMPQASEWESFCQKICLDYQIPLRVAKVELNPLSKLGLEAEARKLRYEVFGASQRDILVLAHHQNDQIETFLLGMLRGGGLRALVAMPELRPLSPKLEIWRPLLAVEKNSIEAYAQHRNLTYIQDASNINENYTRNWLRQSLIPIMQAKVEHFGQQILQNIQSLQEVLQVLEEYVVEDYQKYVDKDMILVASLKKTSKIKAKEILHYFLKIQQLGTPTRKSINDFIAWLFCSDSHYFEWSVPNGSVYVYDGKIWPWSSTNVFKKLFDDNAELVQKIEWRTIENGVSKDFIASNWLVRPMHREDTIVTELGPQRVLNILKNNKVPKFVRQYWPVIANQKNECIVLIGFRVDKRYQSEKGFAPYLEILNNYIN